MTEEPIDEVAALRTQMVSLLGRFDAFLEEDKAWKNKHEHNHHGRMSSLKDKIPWTAVVFTLFGLAQYLLNGHF